MRFSVKEVVLGVITPAILLIIDKSTGDFKVTNMNFLHTVREILPFLLILFSILYFAKLILKRVNSLRNEVKNKIIALHKINSDSDIILKDLFVEGRDRTNNNINQIVISLNKLGDKTIKVRPEDPEITKYKEKLNTKLDEEQDPLYNLLNDWD